MPNRLEASTSPYLLQHKDNPVEWHEWGPDAFEEARTRDVPLLVSVGYAACHWCHVMAHESFEDPDTAAEMNRRFVNVKVDREERPDVDSIYMEAVQAMTGQGGWPMTVWVDHGGRPFFAGTYFPNAPRHGMPAFGQVIEAVSNAWHDKRADVEEQALKLTEAITAELPRSEIEDGVTENGYRAIEASFEDLYGGFGRAPKFPQQPLLEFLLRVHDSEWAPQAGPMLISTLENMAAGGIHDQIGGGFARYSVDAFWLVPHFEKMLYDNAQLARLYLWCGVALDRPDFLEVADGTLAYLTRDLRHPGGGFFSSEDADSEGEEGKFYVWTIPEIESILGDDASAFIDYYGVTGEGNFEGANILHVVKAAKPPGLDAMRARMLDARSRRVRPGLDDKVIASWNGLAIRGLAEAGAVRDDGALIDQARTAARFVLDELVVDGVLRRAWREGSASVPGFLDDHAGMAVGLFSLYAATGEVEWFDSAMGLVDQLSRFDSPGGGFYSTRDDVESLVKRPLDYTDNPAPSGNALAAEALLLAALYTGREHLRDRAGAALESVSALMNRFPTMVAHHLSILHTMSDTRELAIVGADWPVLARVYWSGFRPGVALAGSNTATDDVELLRGRFQPGRTLAYLCRGFVCDLPTDDPAVLAGQLT